MQNSQSFITTHSPTLTSKIPLENLILLKDNAAYHVGNCFRNRHQERIVRDVAANNRLLKEKEVKNYRSMIARYFDVTRSQLLFSNGCMFIEGISECQPCPLQSQVRCCEDNNLGLHRKMTYVFFGLPSLPCVSDRFSRNSDFEFRR